MTRIINYVINVILVIFIYTFYSKIGSNLVFVWELFISGNLFT